MKVWRKLKEIADEPGQSLVETALVLPILIIMLVGIVELSSNLNTQNKVTTASRIAAGFGAANYDRDDFATTTAPAMGQVALNTVTETLVMDTNRWDIWSIKARTNDDGTAFSVFTHTKVYGDESVITVAEWDALVPVIQSDMLDALQSVCEGGGGCDDAADIEVVASVPWYAPDPFLGLPVLEFLNLDRQRGLTVMRVGTSPDVAGCPLLPIAVRINQWSLYPSDWWDEDTETLAAAFDRYPGHDVQPFPPLDDKIWEYPDCDEPDWTDCKGEVDIPVYKNGSIDPFTFPLTVTMPLANLNTGGTLWPKNLPGTPLSPTLNLQIPIGFLFWAREETDELGGNFGWLTWNGDPDANKLKESLDLPAGDLMQIYPGSRADEGQLVNINRYDEGERSGNSDGWLSVNEWVEGTPGNKDVAGRQGVEKWVDTILGPASNAKPVTIILFDELNNDSGSNTNYHVAGFVMARIVGYSFQGSTPANADSLYEGKWLVFELLGPATQCYDPPDIS